MKNIKYITLLLGVLVFLSCSAKQNIQSMVTFEHNQSSDKLTDPLIVLRESNPWAMVMGAGGPTFVLYKNGIVIYRENKKYVSVKLNEHEFHKLLKELKPSSDFLDLKGYYSLSQWTDQPTTRLFVNLNGFKKYSDITANLRSPNKEQKPAPKSFMKLFNKLIAYKHKNAKPWFPKKFEVMASPYEYAPEKSIVWHSDWPDLFDLWTKKRYESYSIYMDASKYQEFEDFLKTRSMKGAVKINNKKWFVDVRLPFPNEKIWMKKKVLY